MGKTKKAGLLVLLDLTLVLYQSLPQRRDLTNSKKHLRQTHIHHTDGTLGKQDEAQSSAKCTKSVRQLIPDRVESFEFVVNFNFIVVGALFIHR